MHVGSVRLCPISTSQMGTELSEHFAFQSDLWALSIQQTELQRQLERAAQSSNPSPPGGSHPGIYQELHHGDIFAEAERETKEKGGRVSQEWKIHLAFLRTSKLQKKNNITDTTNIFGVCSDSGGPALEPQMTFHTAGQGALVPAI